MITVNKIKGYKRISTTTVNNLHQVCSSLKIGIGIIFIRNAPSQKIEKPNNAKVSGTSKKKNINRIHKIAYGYLCLQDELWI